MIHGMLLLGNEVSRELNQKLYVIEDMFINMSKLVDRMVILLDAVNDGTDEYIELFRKKFNNLEIYRLEESLWDKDEKKARETLFFHTIKKAENNDWIVCLDADELLVDEHIPFLRYMLDTVSTQVDGIAFRLYDMWNSEEYRDDNLWCGHLNFWPMIMRYKDEKAYYWHDKKLHCGRFPANGIAAMIPTEIPIKHMGWALEDERIKKYNRYMQVDPEGKNGILAQYKSILDENPSLKKFGGAK